MYDAARNAWTLASAQPFAARGTVGALPADLAFLEPFGIPRASLHDAAARAAWEGTDGRRALLAEGAVSEAFYYRALAWHLGVPFANSWPRPAKPIDLRGADIGGFQCDEPSRTSAVQSTPTPHERAGRSALARGDTSRRRNAMAW